MTRDSKADRQVILDFELATALIMRQESVPASKARALAWLEGPPGLEKRLGTPTLPLKKD